MKHQPTMKRMKKILSLLLACMLMLNSMVLYAVGEEALPTETETASDVALSDVIAEKYDVGDEILEWREEGVKHYYLGDGKYQAVVKAGEMKNSVQSRSSSTTVNSSRYPLDTYLSSSNKAACYGESEEVWVGTTYIGLFYNGKPNLPTNAIIESATMSFSYYYYVSTGSMTVGAYAVEEYWDEYTVTWNEMAAYPDMGISTTPSGTVILSASSTNSENTPTRASVNITDIVRSWYSKERSNEGIALKRISGSNTSVILKSYESEDEDHFAYYVITYSTLDEDVVPKGEYFFQNAKFNKFAEIDNNAFSTDDGAIIEIWDFNAEADQKWKITYLYNGYYKIISTASDKALTAPTSTNTSITQTVYTSSNNQQWIIKRNTDGTYKLSPRSNESFYMAAGAGLITSRGRNVEMREEQSDGRDKWYFFSSSGSEVMLMGISDDGHDHSTALGVIMPDLVQCGYSKFNCIVTDNIDSQIVKNNMAKAKIYVSRSHGNADSDGTYILLSNDGTKWIHARDIYDFANNVTKVNLNGCDLMLFVACYTGANETASLPHAAVKAGAQAAVGFKESIGCSTANNWTQYFFEYYQGGSSVALSSYKAARACGNLSGIDSYRVVTES